MNKKQKIFRFLFCGALVLLTFIITLIIFSKNVLTKNHPVNSKILVIEGWLGSYDLELIQKYVDLDKYETIIVTGIEHPHPEYVKKSLEYVAKELPVVFYKNGCLIIDKNSIAKVCKSDSLSEIDVFASSTRALGKNANFFLAVNDSVIGNADVKAQHLVYKFNYLESMKKIEGIYIYFNNDAVIGNEDRNLTIDSILINDVALDKPSYYLKVYDDQIDENSFTNFPFRSNAALSTRYLKLLGIKNNIITIDTLFNNRNKTLASAKKVDSFLNMHFRNTTSFNVVSVHRHSLRSYLSYRMATHNKKNVGIISIDDSDFKNRAEMKIYITNILDEYFKTFITVVEYLFSK
jgi:hypothetical protein